MTTVYLIRHSEKLRNTVNINNSDSFQISNEKIVLSSKGEEKAKRLSEINEMKDIDAVFSSTYTRAISTAKYIADVNNTDIKIIEDLGERVYGINSLDEIVPFFEQKQWEDENYCLENGESRKQVTERIYNALISIFNEYKEKRIAIISHGTAISFLLNKWCDVYIDYNSLSKVITRIVFNNEIVFDGNFDAPEVFKLIFDDNFNLMDIKNVDYEKDIL